MKIGVVVYSQTGNTRSVADKLRDALTAAGHTVTAEEVKLVGERTQGNRAFTLGPRSDLSAYDVLVFGAAVEAFSLSPVLTAYLKAIPALDGKRVACLVTQGFPYRWLGGNRAVCQMRRLCEAKGGKVLGGAVVNWMGAGRNKRISRAVEELVKLF